MVTTFLRKKLEKRGINHKANTHKGGKSWSRWKDTEDYHVRKLLKNNTFTPTHIKELAEQFGRSYGAVLMRGNKLRGKKWKQQ